MQPELRDYLALFSNVAIAAVALSGIIMMLAVSDQRPNKTQISQIGTQLRMSLTATVFAVLPVMLSTSGIEMARVWQICSALYVVAIVYFIASAVLDRVTYGQHLPKSTRIASGTSAISALFLMGSNIWLCEPWPYITQLFIALVMAMILFLEFIIQTLIERAR